MSRLAEHDSARQAWERKPALRAVYLDLYREIAARLDKGPTLEIGAGGGRFRDEHPDVVCCDLAAGPGIDVVANAQALPFAAGSFTGIAMLDVLHHIAIPRLFLQEAARVLRPGGRIVFVEPGITPASYPFYRWLHPEPLVMSVDPLGTVALSSERPYDSNQAIPTLLATRHGQRLGEVCPSLRIAEIRWLSAFAFPLSGGLRPWSLISEGGVRRLLALERRLPARLMRLLAFRLLLVLEKDPYAAA